MIRDKRRGDDYGRQIKGEKRNGGKCDTGGKIWLREG